MTEINVYSISTIKEIPTAIRFLYCPTDTTHYVTQVGKFCPDCGAEIKSKMFYPYEDVRP